MFRDPDIRRLLRFVVVALVPLTVGVFLLASRYSASWDGHAVAMRPISGEPPPAYEVRIVETDGGSHVQTWRRETVEGLRIPEDPLLLEPVTLPEAAVYTRKERFSLHFLVREPDDRHRVVPTTSPQALAMTLLAALLTLAFRNMLVSGSPVEFRPRATRLPEPLPSAGQPAAPKGSRPGVRRGPPPKGGKRKRRRR